MGANDCKKCNGLGCDYVMEGKTLIQIPCEHCNGKGTLFLDKFILASWDNFLMGNRGSRVIQTKTEVEVLEAFENAGHLQINSWIELNIGG